MAGLLDAKSLSLCWTFVSLMLHVYNLSYSPHGRVCSFSKGAGFFAAHDLSIYMGRISPLVPNHMVFDHGVT
ncbi:uncharacterized protein BDW47DRAFT_106469 [Aspergillus candidus]|uniref:Secreted protein n=1 Tax=Aspergillus candidus TaxID=41067 RepID=A0A2I2FB26_ASPCN|nr:hypothetical protein BDW47DRAFT_106469 [Aspergillus candidus]PLB37838.1 hypothetical protein BDW47DRAFT_106469 [Aspergillus candidus]